MSRRAADDTVRSLPYCTLTGIFLGLLLPGCGSSPISQQAGPERRTADGARVLDVKPSESSIERALAPAAAHLRLSPPAAAADVFRELPDDPPLPRPAPLPVTAPRHPGPWRQGNFESVQVNVNALGENISGDAANEPSIAVDPTDPDRIVIGWRQFDNVASNFRQAGWAYSHDGGRTWTFPGVLEPGVFGSDPVVEVDPDGNFYYYSLQPDRGPGQWACYLYKSFDGGMTWPQEVYAWGGDKAWITVDRTGGIGDGHSYAVWTQFFGCCTGSFTRSTDGGTSFLTPLSIEGDPYWGTMAVGPDGELYISSGGSIVVRSDDARNPAVTPTFRAPAFVNLGGFIVSGAGPNPGGLLGQVWVDCDRSSGPSRGNVYVLASVAPFSSTDPLDVMFARSTDGGQTWAPPVRVNDDSPANGAWQWFGTMAVAPSGRIDVIWNDTRADPTAAYSQLYYSNSQDAGFTWSPNVSLSAPFNPALGYPSQNKIGDYYDMVSNDDAAYVAYAATFNGEHDVYFLRITFDCNTNGVPDDEDIAAGTSADCTGNQTPDECEPDCNTSGAADSCDIASGTSQDCTGNGTPDECEPDCNVTGLADSCDIAGGTSIDCNSNGRPDECELASQDCNENGVPDDCDILGGTSADCRPDGVPDECELAGNDCNSNGTHDDCDIIYGTSTDCRLDGVPDECELAGHDCNSNAAHDDCDILSGMSADCRPDGVPDECEVVGHDCDLNGTHDDCDAGVVCEPDAQPSGQNMSTACAGMVLSVVTTGGSVHAVTSPFASTGDQVFGNQFGGYLFDASGIRAQFAVPVAAVSIDIVADTPNDGGRLEAYDTTGALCRSSVSGPLMAGQWQTLTVSCPQPIGSAIVETGFGQNQAVFDHLVIHFPADCDRNGVPDECEPDCNSNGAGDGCDIFLGSSPDCNQNAVPDECDLAAGTSRDCNENATPDGCDLAAALEFDCHSNGVPDSCEIVSGSSFDCDSNGIPDECDFEVCAANLWGGFDSFNIGTPINGLDYNGDGNAWTNPSGSWSIFNQGCPSPQGKAVKATAQTPPIAPTEFVRSEYFLTDGLGRPAPATPKSEIMADLRLEALLNPRIDWQITLKDAGEGDGDPNNDANVILIHLPSTQSTFTGVGSNRGRMLVRNPDNPSGFLTLSPAYVLTPNQCFRIAVELSNNAPAESAVKLYVNGALRLSTKRLGPTAKRMDYFHITQVGNNQVSGGTQRLALDNFDFCQTGGALAPGGLIDCNANGVLDRCDITAGAAGDCDPNGVPDSCEHPGDFDCDGDVDSADADVSRNCFSGSGHSPAAGCGPADLDADGDVDCADWSIVRDAWTAGPLPGMRRCPRVTPVPTATPQTPTGRTPDAP